MFKKPFKFQTLSAEVKVCEKFLPFFENVKFQKLVTERTHFSEVFAKYFPTFQLPLVMPSLLVSDKNLTDLRVAGVSLLSTQHYE